MTRLGLLLKTYSRHVRTYVVVYTLVLVSIVIPVSVTLLSGMLDHAFVSFLHDQVMAGDVLVTPLSDNNLQAGTLPTLSGMAEYYIDEAIVNSFSSTEECTYTLYSHIGGTNQEYFIYEDLTEPGQQVSLIVSDAIPEGVFSARPSLDVPGSVYLVTGAGQSYVQLKRAEDFIPFPSAYQFDIAISRSDANRLMIPAKRA